MKRTLIAGLCLISVAAIAADTNRFYEIRSSLYRRTNGALLTATASLTANEPKAIIISWELDYTGPRLPFTILTPTTTAATFGQTVVVIYADGKEYRLSSPALCGKYKSMRDWFITMPKGEKAHGVISVPLSQVKEYFLKHWPQDFNMERPPDLRVQLEHKPHDRGDEFSLDAWTGDLYSPVLEVRLDKW